MRVFCNLPSSLLPIALLCGCHPSESGNAQRIEFTRIPDAGPRREADMEEIAGRAVGAKRGQRIVLFAKSGTWWVQPYTKKPFTEIERDSTFRSAVHLGTEYAALLVEPGYAPPRTTDVLPGPGRDVVAVATVKGVAVTSEPPPKRIQFSGYEWEVRQTPSASATVMHVNSPSNAWTDKQGRLHLQIAQENGQWTCAEVSLLRSLGYGSYSFVASIPRTLEPGTVLGMFTWDEAEAGQNHREMDVELSQWGDPASKNAQFVIQPFFVPANVFRYTAPAGVLTHSFRWENGRVSFRTLQTTPGRAPRKLAEHVFTSGVPTPGGEAIHINLYTYGASRTPQRNGAEVVIEKFEYLP